MSVINRLYFDMGNSDLIIMNINQSALGHLNPRPYYDVGSFSAWYLNFNVNYAGVYSN
jgi:hypothetical protein